MGVRRGNLSMFGGEAVLPERVKVCSDEWAGLAAAVRRWIG